MRRSEHVKYIAPSEKVEKQLPTEEMVKNYGRTSKLLLAEKDIPDLHFNVKDNHDSPVEVVELTSVNTCGLMPQNSKFRERLRKFAGKCSG